MTLSPKFARYFVTSIHYKLPTFIVWKSTFKLHFSRSNESQKAEALRSTFERRNINLLKVSTHLKGCLLHVKNKRHVFCKLHRNNSLISCHSQSFSARWNFIKFIQPSVVYSVLSTWRYQTIKKCEKFLKTKHQIKTLIPPSGFPIISNGNLYAQLRKST